MADGTAKQLQNIVVGDEVLSWDEVMQQPATSTVMHVPVFQRETSDLVEIVLPARQLYATEDHPIWSRGKRGLVSLRPNQTAAQYDLLADLMSMDEELESHDLQAVQVSAIRRPHASPNLRRRLLETAGSGTHVDVMTLCLEPFHWYYAAGVRVHNKGCFVGSTDVSLANGTTKQLQHVQVGDEVLSWDEDAQQAATSVVRHVPTFEREHGDMAEVVLPHGQLYVTDDHPIWSHGRQGLVSLHPNRTAAEYDLEADLMSADEELEGHDLQPVRISAFQKLHTSPQLRRRLLESPGNTSHVEVMTLCLEPHHWYYAQGVRVHNKGCFAPWTRVSMPDRSSKAISDVQVDDVVLSWNSEAGEVSQSRVVEVYAFPAEDLVQLSLNHSADRLDASGVALHARSTSSLSGLVLTADHPVYSSRHRGPVSFRPERTRSFYGLPVGQLLESDVLQDSFGREVHALAQSWTGGEVSTVLTLKLDPHPWFYAEGVLVHNKGGGDGIIPRPWKSAKAFDSPEDFAFFVIAHTRRRLNTFIDNEADNCDFKENYSIVADNDSDVPDIPQTQENVRKICSEVFLNSSVENKSDVGIQCDRCDNHSCVRELDGCVEFLSTLYDSCQGKRDLYFLWILLGVVASVLMGSGIYVLRFAWGRKGRARMMKQARQLRLGKAGANGHDLASMNLTGTITERGRSTKQASYKWSVDRRGMLDGSGPDQDGTARVSGVVCWRPGGVSGEVLWGEQRPGCEIEAKGTITTAGADVIVAATYFGFEGRRSVRGSLSVSTAPTYEMN